jgi:hypothetical protein
MSLGQSTAVMEVLLDSVIALLMPKKFNLNVNSITFTRIGAAYTVKAA